MIKNEQLKGLAKALEGGCFYDFMEDIKQKVADVRSDIDLDVQQRRMLVKIIDDLIIQRLKTLANPVEKPKDNWA